MILARFEAHLLARRNETLDYRSHLEGENVG